MPLLTVIITAVILSLAVWVFKLYWKALVKFVFHLMERAIDLISRVITVVKRFGKAIWYLYRRYRNGKIFRRNLNENSDGIEEEPIDDPDLLPEELRNALNLNEDEEVIVRPEEF